MYERGSDAYQQRLDGIVKKNPTFTILGKRFRLGRLLSALSEMNIAFLDELAFCQDAPTDFDGTSTARV